MEIKEEVLLKLKFTFPKSYHIFKDEVLNILDPKKNFNNSATSNHIYLNKDEINYINKKIESNIKLLIYNYSDNKHVSAFTIPGLIDKDMLTSFNGLSDVINCNMNLYRLNLKGEKDKNNKIILTSKISNKILPLFIEKSLYHKITRNELMSLYLHEIGHWINYRLYFPKLLLSSIFQIQYLFLNPLLFVPSITGAAGLSSYLTNSAFTTMLFNCIVLYLIIGICIASLISAIQVKNEFDSDSFAKKMGYGEELANIFKKDISNTLPLRLENDANLSSLTKKSIIMMSMLSPIVYSLFWYLKSDPDESIESHPNHDKRVKLLLADSINYVKSNEFLIYENFENFRIKYICESMENVNFPGIYSSFDSLFTNFDNFIFSNAKTLFPHRIIF
jgi:Zn-dependent protease with chaperone function